MIETRLLEELLAEYDYRARPQYDAINVTLMYMLENIMELTWVDQRLRWEPSRFRNQTYVVIPATDVWIPDIIFRNSIDEAYGPIFDRTKFRVQARQSGQVTYTVAGRSTTTCLLDVTYFPFDSQACYIEINSWMYPIDQVFFHPQPDLDTAIYRPHGVWKLVDTAAVYRVEYNYATARFVIYITRKPMYFIITLILPCILFSLLMLLVFLLPPESGEKISLQITVLLSFTVFQLLVASSMPQTSDFTPFISIYIYGIMGLAGLSMFCTVGVLLIHHEHRRPLPRFLRLVVHDIIGKLLCMNTSNSVTQSPEMSSPDSAADDETTSRHQNDAENDRKTNDNWTSGELKSTRSSTDHHGDTRNEWIKTAKIIDRFCLVVFVIVIFVMTSVLFAVMGVSGPRNVEPITQSLSLE